MGEVHSSRHEQRTCTVFERNSGGLVDGKEAWEENPGMVEASGRNHPRSKRRICRQEKSKLEEETDVQSWEREPASEAAARCGKEDDGTEG